MAPSKYAVLGAGGPTGKECVNALLETGADVVAVVRDPAKYKDVLPAKAQLTPGDVTKPDSLGPALQGCKGVVFAASGTGYWSAKSVDTEGVANAAKAAKEAGAEQFVLVSSQLVTPKQRLNPIRMMLNNIRWGLMDAKFAGENELKKVGIPYTIVRPGRLSNGAGGVTQVLSGQGDDRSAGAGAIPRADVAAVCVQALQNPAARNVTMEISGGNESVDSQTYMSALKNIFSTMKPDA